VIDYLIAVCHVGSPLACYLDDNSDRIGAI
jgi:hypothetical protein